MFYVESYTTINNARILHTVMRYGINNNIDKKIIVFKRLLTFVFVYVFNVLLAGHYWLKVCAPKNSMCNII